MTHPNPTPPLEAAPSPRTSRKVVYLVLAVALLVVAAFLLIGAFSSLDDYYKHGETAANLRSKADQVEDENRHYVGSSKERIERMVAANRDAQAAELQESGLRWVAIGQFGASAGCLIMAGGFVFGAMHKPKPAAVRAGRRKHRYSK